MHALHSRLLQYAISGAFPALDAFCRIQLPYFFSTIDSFAKDSGDTSQTNQHCQTESVIQEYPAANIFVITHVN
jgi:hypothetical protein